MTPEEIRALVESNAQRRGVDPEIIMRMIQAESSGNPNAVSGAGAQGLMQLMPRTATSLGVTDPFNPGQNVAGGVDYWADLLQQSDGNPVEALAKWNFGPGNIAKGRPIPAETSNFVDTVMSGGGAPPAAPVQPRQPLTIQQITSDPDFAALSESDQNEALDTLIGPNTSFNYRQSLNGPKMSAGTPIPDEPSSISDALERVLSASGISGLLDRAMGGIKTTLSPPPSTTPTLEEQPLNETDAAGVIRGLYNTAMTALSPYVGGMTPGTFLPMTGGGILGAVGGEAGGRSLGESVGAPETGSALGEALGAFFGGGVGSKLGPAPAATTESLGQDLAGRVLRSVKPREQPVDLPTLINNSVAASRRTVAARNPVRGQVPVGQEAVPETPAVATAAEREALINRGPVRGKFKQYPAQSRVLDQLRVKTPENLAAEAAQGKPPVEVIEPVGEKKVVPRKPLYLEGDQAESDAGLAAQADIAAQAEAESEAKAKDFITMLRRSIISAKEAPPELKAAAEAAEAEAAPEVTPTVEKTPEVTPPTAPLVEAAPEVTPPAAPPVEAVPEPTKPPVKPSKPKKVPKPKSVVEPPSNPTPAPLTSSGESPVNAPVGETAAPPTGGLTTVISGKTYRVGDVITEGAHQGKTVLDVDDSGIPVLSARPKPGATPAAPAKEPVKVAPINEASPEAAADISVPVTAVSRIETLRTNYDGLMELGAKDKEYKDILPTERQGPLAEGETYRSRAEELLGKKPAKKLPPLPLPGAEPTKSIGPVGIRTPETMRQAWESHGTVPPEFIARFRNEHGGKVPTPEETTRDLPTWFAKMGAGRKGEYPPVRGQRGGAAPETPKDSERVSTERANEQERDVALTRVMNLLGESYKRIRGRAAKLLDEPELEDMKVKFGTLGLSAAEYQGKRALAEGAKRTGHIVIDPIRLAKDVSTPEEFADSLVYILKHEPAHSRGLHIFPKKNKMKISGGKIAEVSSDLENHTTENMILRAAINPEESRFLVGENILSHDPDTLKVLDQLRKNVIDSGLYEILEKADWPSKAYAEKMFPPSSLPKVTPTKPVDTAAVTLKASSEKQPEDFKKWFGESKVVDKKSEPKIVYHGSGTDFNEFKLHEKSRAGAPTSSMFWASERPEIAEVYATGFPFGSKAASGDQANIRPLHLLIKNPLVIPRDMNERIDYKTFNDILGFDSLISKQAQKDIVTKGKAPLWKWMNRPETRTALIGKGFDGVRVKEGTSYTYPDSKGNPVPEDEKWTWGFLESNQAKSAMGQRKTYGPENPDVLKALKVKTPE